MLPIRSCLFPALLMAYLAMLSCGGGGGTTPATPAPVAAFTLTPANPVAGQAIQFTDTSSGSPTSWSWNFGDGGASSLQSPSHSYPTAGSYKITLTASNAVGSSTASNTLAVVLAPPVAGFSVSNSAPMIGQSVNFTDTSTGTPNTWSWNFGDGSTSDSQHASHTYTSAGNFTVSLTTSNAGGSSTASKPMVVSQAAPVAAFTYTPALPVAGQTVSFTDTSTGGPSQWIWNFGDGTSAASKNPTHSYTAAGSYAVSLIASNAGGSSTVSKTLTVGLIAPVASFDYSPSSPTVSQAVGFTDSSTGNPTAWSWSFGDGTTSSLKNPAHIFNNPGSYTVTLTASNTGGSAQALKTLTVRPLAPVAGFSFSPSAPTMGQPVSFTDSSTGNPTAWSWSFGDGGVSSTQHPVHSFPAAGNYTVTLTASNSAGSAVANKTVAVSSGSVPKAAFSFTPSSPIASQAVSFRDASTGAPSSWTWSFGDGGTSALQNPSHSYASTGLFTVTLTAANPAGQATSSQNLIVSPAGVEFTLSQSVSDQAQRTTLAFSGLAMITGNLEAQSFFPPGKVADYTGFQYLRDNDPDRMGHNTSFLTRVANNVIYLLNTTQFEQLKTLAVAQQTQIGLYGYKRFPLMKAFRRLMDGDLPTGATGLNLEAVKQASKELYLLDGQISYDRALLYANIIKSLDASQTSYLQAMKGKGWNSWPNVSDEQIKAKMQGLPQGTAVAVMTYASDLFSWYAGSLDADVYFCPERHGTYYGGFYIKDAPAIGHEGYSIDEQLTATAGAALSDSSKGYVNQEQATLMSSLVETQRSHLYGSPSSNIVKLRTDIASLMRQLLSSSQGTEAIQAQVLELSGKYGELDGENNYQYATVFNQVNKSLSSDQKTKLMNLRKSILSGKYADGTPFDFTICTTPFHYSSVITDLSQLMPYLSNTDYFFLGASTPTAAFTFSPATPSVDQTVSFTDASTGGPTSWSWNFGDGHLSSLQNPTHTYSAPGNYVVNLLVGNTLGTHNLSKTITITTNQGSLSLSSELGPNGSTLPSEYGCDGAGISPPLSWSNAPSGTKSFALLMTTPTPEGVIKYNWVLYNIPASTSSLVKNTSGVGISGISNNGTLGYQAPYSQGPGAKEYTFTLYALSATPILPSGQVSGEVLSQAIASLTLGSASLRLNHTRISGGPVAAFDFSPVLPALGQNVSFTDRSTGTPTTWAWNFGDGATSSLQNPSHSYSAPGSYTVSLNVSNATGSNSTSKSLTVSGTQGLFTLNSSVAANGGNLPIDTTLDGSGTSPDLSWSNVPAGTKELALLMTTLPGDGSTLYNWVLFRIPATASSLPKGNTSIGTGGMTSHALMGYAPPQSTGPGAKLYTFTLIALSASPTLPSDPAQVTGAVLNQAISSLKLGTATLNLYYSRSAPVADFGSTINGTTVSFVSACGLSTSSWNWNFGDGRTSTEKNPTHVYSNAGSYTVTLTASNAFGGNTASKTVIVSAPSAPVASFFIAPGSPVATQTAVFTDTSAGSPSSWLWSFGDGATSSERYPIHVYSRTGSFSVSLKVSNALGTHTTSQTITVVASTPSNVKMNMAQTISDQAQRTTLAFSGLAMMTGNLEAQSFYPPGKVADYTAFQYLRDNDPSNMGHNTSFLTRVANNVIYILNTSQLAQLAALATTQQAQFELYGYKRFPLMKAFRRLMEGDIPSGSSGLNLNAVKKASRELYLLDGQISYDRALLYANIYRSLDATQKAYLDAMVGKGWSSWPDIKDEQIKEKMKTLPQGSAVAVMTYASDIFSWYACPVEGDVYFCPERQGTYYGGFYIKDAPAIGHEGYGIDEQLTATAGAALCDASKGYVTQSQATTMSSLVETQRNNLYASSTSSIVFMRTEIATLLRALRTSSTHQEVIKSRVLALSETYGDLDGENNFNYAKVFAQVYKTLSTEQKSKLMDLRKSIMSGTYADGTPFDYTICTTPFLYSAVIKDLNLLSPYLAGTDTLFFEP